MIKITTIFGEDAVREYEENNELPSEEWLADNGGVVDEKEFETEAEYNAYIAGVNDADGWSDYHIIRHRSEEADTSREENLWLRLGISVRGSREDIERILNGDTETAPETARCRTLWDWRRDLCPWFDRRGYNEDHDTEFEEEDVEFHL